MIFAIYALLVSCLFFYLNIKEKKLNSLSWVLIILIGFSLFYFGQAKQASLNDDFKENIESTLSERDSVIIVLDQVRRERNLAQSERDLARKEKDDAVNNYEMLKANQLRLIKINNKHISEIHKMLLEANEDTIDIPK